MGTEKEAWNFSKSQGLYRKGNSEFFQVPEAIWRRQKNDTSRGRRRKLGIFPSPRVYIERKARNFSKSQKLYGEGRRMTPRGDGEGSLEFF